MELLYEEFVETHPQTFRELWGSLSRKPQNHIRQTGKTVLPDKMP